MIKGALNGYKRENTTVIGDITVINVIFDTTATSATTATTATTATSDLSRLHCLDNPSLT